jgi:hypothetical protein
MFFFEAVSFKVADRPSLEHSSNLYRQQLAWDMKFLVFHGIKI